MRLHEASISHIWERTWNGLETDLKRTWNGGEKSTKTV